MDTTPQHLGTHSPDSDAEKKRNTMTGLSAQDSRHSIAPGELVAYSEIDSVLAAKMHLVNQAINQLGFTPYHWKLFCLNGFGYAVDSLLAYLMSITASQVALEFRPSYARGGQIGLYVGLLAGALFWGIGADLVGRKWAFNLSLFIASIFSVIAGGSPNYVSWATFVALGGFGAGGNLVLDTTVFLEYIPSNKQWMVTLMAVWWGLGQTTAGLFAWAFLRKSPIPHLFWSKC
jgi:MFS family permease